MNGSKNSNTLEAEIKKLTKLTLAKNGFGWTKIRSGKIKNPPEKRNITFEVCQDGYAEGNLLRIQDSNKFVEVVAQVASDVSNLVALISTVDPEEKGYEVSYSFSQLIPYIRIKPLKK